MSYRTRSVAALAGLVLASASIAIGATAAGATRVAKQDSGVIYITIVHQRGGLEYAAGYANDKLFGPIAVTYVVSVGSGKPGTFLIKAKKATFYTSTGSISGTGSGIQTVTSTKIFVSDGKISLTHGAGSQAGHSFTGTFSGPYDSTTMVFTFHYRGVYK
jgi:hypothetical protein